MVEDMTTSEKRYRVFDEANGSTLDEVRPGEGEQEIPSSPILI